MITAETEQFLHRGCALIVGTNTVDGDPFAARGWGLSVLDAEAGRVRLLLRAEDLPILELHETRPVLAVTAADVRTLRSIQLKGRVEQLEAADEADRERANQYCEAFFSDIEAVDGTPRYLVERVRPAHYAACVFRVEEIYDQTPGPGAGEPIVEPS